MANPNEVRPEEQATATENSIPELSNLTPHPEEFQSVAKEVISTMATDDSSSMEETGKLEAVEVVHPPSTPPATLLPSIESNQPTITDRVPVKPSKANWQSRLGLKEKASLAALLLTVIPTIAIGGLAYSLSLNALKQEGSQSSLARAESLAAETNSFMSERYKDIKAIAQLPFLTDAQLRETFPLSEQQANLETYRATSGVYTSIAAFDLKGDVIAQSTSGKILENHLDRNYIQAVLTTGKPHISQPQISKTTGEVAVYFAAPILDSYTGEMIGVVRSRMLTEALSPLMDSFSQAGYAPHIADQNGVLIAASEAELIGKGITTNFQSLAPLVEAGESGSVDTVNATENTEELVSYTPLPAAPGLPELGWSASVSVEKEILFASQKQLLLALLLGTTAIAGIVALISVYLAGRATRPVIQAAEVVEKMGFGQLDARLEVPQNGDEMALLGSNINRMGEQIQTLLQAQGSDARLASLLTDIARLQNYDALNVPLANALKEIQQQMGSCRVAFARITDNYGSSKVIAEAVKPSLSQSQGQSLPALSEVQLHHFQNKQKPRAYKHLSTEDFTPELLSQLQAFQVQSVLYAPVFVNSQLYGLLSLQVCDRVREWSSQEVDRLAEWGNRLGLVLNSVESFEQAKKRSELEREQKETIQRELITLLSEVEGASSGDLTVRAQITDGEIGIVADFFNAIVENLRDVVTQVKQTSSQVNSSVNNDGDSIRRLSTDAIEQATQINVTLASIEEMTNRLQTVAQQATEAAQAAQTAETTAKAGGQAMEDTVNSISEVRQTVADTAKQVKRLGESSQQISKVVELINQIALKTNLLAVNAGIEAARAGEEGRGFAVVAEEVGALAAQSAVATKEIEQIINSIQTGTSNVVEAMESSTSKVVEGTRSVEEAQKSLEQILEVSREVNGAFQLISNETTMQATVAEQVKQMMAQVAQVSTETSNASREVSESLQTTAEITEKLQLSVGAFKVDTDS